MSAGLTLERGGLGCGMCLPVKLRPIPASTCAVWLLTVVMPAVSQETLGTKDFKITIDATGHIARLHDAIHQREYLAPNQPAPLLAVKTGGTVEEPSAAVFQKGQGLIRLNYAKSGVSIDVRILEKDTHVTFELVRAEPADAVSLVIWGPYPIAIDKTVGEVIGVVRNGEYAIGIQTLNVKTQAGYPENGEGLGGQAARRMPWGGVLQAYCMDRTKPRRIEAWGFPNMPIPPIPGETVVGSKIALFGCAEPRALETIGSIEVAEGLPHPLIDGVWAKVSPEKGRSYLITDFSERNVDEVLRHVKRANLMTLYHEGPFKSWGHYEPNPGMFPNGVRGVKACAEKARSLGIRLGAHTLSNFIQTNDPYVTPIPDPRLARTGSSLLTQDVDAKTTDIGVASPEYFANKDRNWMHTVVIDQELMRYREVSTAEPWRLLGCTRGAFGTKPALHKKGTEVGKLLDHPYKVFFPNLELQREIAANLARRFNEAGLGQMDFDGHEGCLASGQGTYATELFAKDFYDHLTHTVLNGTSGASHFYWHINSYCNWGEPWYGGFRDSMQEYRINNQAFFERNFMPGMLGWYLMTETTCLSDMEWMLARAAGFNAGFALATSPTALRKNPETTRIMDAIREWEDARRSGAFTAAQRERMKNPKNEFRLEMAGEGAWNLFPLQASKDFTHERTTLQPGQPTSAQWNIENPGSEQALQFRVCVAGEEGSIANPTIELDNSATFAVPTELKAGQTLLCEGTPVARIYDKNGNQIKAVKAKMPPPNVTRGSHAIAFDCEFRGSPTPKVIVSFKTVDKPERVKKPGT